MNIAKERVVTVEYTLKDADGRTLDTSAGRTPLTYIQGVGSMIPGFEAALEGKGPEGMLSFVVEPSQGYGERNESMLFSIPRERFQNISDLQVGKQVQVRTPHGTITMTVFKIDDESITLDANHPMAGKKLFFEVKVLNVRDATEEELQNVYSRIHGCDSSCNQGCEDGCS